MSLILHMFCKRGSLQISVFSTCWRIILPLLIRKKKRVKSVCKEIRSWLLISSRQQIPLLLWLSEQKLDKKRVMFVVLDKIYVRHWPWILWLSEGWCHAPLDPYQRPEREWSNKRFIENLHFVFISCLIISFCSVVIARKRLFCLLCWDKLKWCLVSHCITCLVSFVCILILRKG